MLDSQLINLFVHAFMRLCYIVTLYRFSLAPFHSSCAVNPASSRPSSYFCHFFYLSVLLCRSFDLSLALSLFLSRARSRRFMYMKTAMEMPRERVKKKHDSSDYRTHSCDGRRAEEQDIPGRNESPGERGRAEKQKTSRKLLKYTHLQQIRAHNPNASGS